MSLITELKRRNVFKVGAAYLALAWLVLQLTSIVVPAFELPGWTLKFVIWFGVIGFPCVLVFAWIYELTPEGLKRDSEVDPGQSITHLTGRRLDYAIVVLLVLAIAMAALQYVRPPAAPVVATRDATVTPLAPAAEVAAPLPSVSALEPAAVAPDDKSIAVLPFVNMSSDKEQEYFSDGMSEELLNLLAQAQDLKVIARTSSFAFKGKDVPIAEIAKQLNVAHVLEGSVRKAGNTVRITAQLIRTADSTHLWSETYDRPLDDVFAVQDEIANAIVQALQIRMMGGTLSQREGGTQNLEAYQLYLRAVSESNLSTTSSLRNAEAFLQKAVQLDSNYGIAWAELAMNSVLKFENGMASAESLQHIVELARHALSVSPEIAEAHGALAYVYGALEWNWAAAEIELRRALELNPTNPSVLQLAGRLAIPLGQWDVAEERTSAALARDPLNTYAYLNLGLIYYLSGRFEEAESVYRKLLSVEPSFPWVHGNLSYALLMQGKTDAALAMIQQAADEAFRLASLPVMLQAAGRNAEADEALKEQIAQWADSGAYFVAQSYAVRGDSDKAIEWLERAYRQKDPALIEITGEPVFKSVVSDPRFKEILRKMNLPTEPVPVNWQ